MKASQSNNHWRNGLSLMEVLFAIGVLMVGLLGIAAVLPVATKNASVALRIDATTAAVENQISNATARFQSKPTTVDLPVPSQTGFEGTGTAPNTGVLLGGIWTTNPGATPPDIAENVRVSAARKIYQRIPVESLKSALPFYDPSGNFPPYNSNFRIPAPGVNLIVDPLGIDPPRFEQQFAPAFCVDPAFIAASDNLRPDAGNVDARTVNYYDRTKFPCYDINYSPLVSPSLQMSGASAWPITPRMLRVATASTGPAAPIPNDVVAKALYSERDVLPIARPKDRTLPPSFFFRQTGNSTNQTNTTRSGNYSSIVMFAPTNASAVNYEAHVVVYESRQLLQFNTSTLNNDFDLSPYTSSVWPLGKNTNYSPQTYPEEVMGIVIEATDVIREGVGRFKFAHSNTCNPDIKVGQWLMLSRFNTASGVNDYGWYQVSSVLSSPRAPNNDLNVTNALPVYVTEVEVRGKDWIFHPLMVDAANPTVALPYPNLDAPPPNMGASTAFEIIAAKQNATIVVKAPRVVAVRSFQL